MPEQSTYRDHPSVIIAGLRQALSAARIERDLLREAAIAVVDQDCSTREGEQQFERAVHRLWMVVHGKESPF